MKLIDCMACGTKVKIEDDYEPKYCCNGSDCTCMGYPTNPVFCDRCEELIFGNKEK